MNDSPDPGPQLFNAFAAGLSHDAPCGFLVTDLKGRALYVNGTLGGWLNRAPEKIAGQVRINEILTRQSHLYYETQIAPMIQLQGFAREIACKLQVRGRPDPLPVLMNVVLRKADDTLPARMDFVFFDATERARFEQQLRTARDEAEELAAIVRNATVGIVRCNGEGRIKRLNGAAARILGVDACNPPDTPLAQLLMLETKNDDWFADALRRIEATGADHRIDASCKDTHYNISVAAIADPETPFAPADYSVILRDVSQRVQSEQRLQLLVGELNHRIGNVFSVVSGLVRQTIRNSTDERDKLIDRLHSLATSHETLTRNQWQDARVTDITAALTAQAGDGQTIQASGPDIRLRPNQFKALSMAVHELTTNSRKYGALSADAGKVEVAWSLNGPNGDAFEFLWRESGGPPVTPPDKTGFGTVMMKRVLTAEFAGRVDLSFCPDGLEFVLRATLDAA